MTDADFSSAATPDGGAAPPSAPAADAGAAETYSPQRDGDGNQFSGDTRTVDAHPSSRDARDDGEQPLDLDAPREWQGAEAGLRAEEIIKELAPPQRPQRPQDFPRSWATDADTIGVWNSLPEQARQQVARREQERDSEVTRRQSEFAERTREVETVIAHAEQTNQQALQALVPDLEQFRDLFEQGALAQEQQRNPERARQFEELFNRVEFLRQRGQQMADVRAEQRQQQIAAAIEPARQAWQRELQAEDAAFVKLVPAAADPAKAEGIEKRIKSRLREELGVSQEEFDRLWETTPLFRRATTRNIIHESNMWRAAQRAAYEAKPKQAPKPLMPGVNNGAGRVSGDAALFAAADAGNMDEYIRQRGGNRRMGR
jgi:hypothetical protein